MTHINWLGFVALFIFLIWIFPNVRRIAPGNKLLYSAIWITAFVVLLLIYSYFFAPEYLPIQPDKPIYSV